MWPIAGGVLTDPVWARWVALLPGTGGRRGRPWGGHRRSVKGILSTLRTGAPWRELPARYGPWNACSSELHPVGRNGTWDRWLTAVPRRAQAKRGGIGEVDSDHSAVRAHPQAASAHHRAGRDDAVAGVEHPVEAAWAGAAAG